MPGKQKSIKKARMRGKGAYYPGGMTLRGKGGFFQDVGDFFKKAAGPVLGAVGGVANTIWPGSGMVADGIRKLIGAGAYSPVRSNAILAQPVPKVGSSSDVGISYSHQEYLGDVTGSVDWELTQFHVNPGLPEVFPWLCGVASNFQKYRIDGLVFYLRSTSSVAIASTDNLGLGTVMGGFQNNVYDKPPGSKLEFLSLSGARSGKPSEDHIFPMECDRSKNVFGNLLVRTTGVGDDLAKYDHAVFNLATVGFPASYYLGELWVSYKLTLMAPKVESQSAVIATKALYTSTPTPAYTRQMLEATVSSVGGGYLCCVPPVTDSSVIWNTSGWTTGVAANGLPCMLVPAGSSGYYLINITTSTTSGSYFIPTFDVFDGTGTQAVDKTVISPCSTSGTDAEAAGKWHTETVVINLVVPPDRPMKLGLQCVQNDEVAPKYNLTVIKLPDRMYSVQTGAATVSLAQKVQRIQRSSANIAFRAQEALERKENLLAAPVLYRTEPTAQTPNSDQSYACPVPVRASGPSLEVQLQTAPQSVLAKHR